jgi:transcription factor E2F3
MIEVSKMADKKSNKMLNIKRKRLQSRLSLDLPEKTLQKSPTSLPPGPEETSQEDFIENEIDEGRQENSLCLLTKKVLQYIKNTKKLNININELVKHLEVKKRRIYDITNVLQGIGYIEKKGKNEIIWTKNQSQIMSKKNIKLKNNAIKICKQENELNELNKKMDAIKEEIISISSKKDFCKYGYITFTDIINLSKNENMNLLIVKANKGTKVDIMDKKNTKKTCEEIFRQFQEGKIELKQKNYKKMNLLKNENHVLFDSLEPKSIKVYRINKGELNEIVKDENKGMYFFINKDINDNNNIKKENNAIIQNIKNNNDNDSNLKLNINDNDKKLKNFNNDIFDSLKLQKNEKCTNDLENSNNQSIDEKNLKHFSVYTFLEWNKNKTYEKDYFNIRNKYCGVSSLFQK